MINQAIHDEATFQMLVAIFQIEELIARIRHRVRHQKAAAETSGTEWAEVATLVQTRTDLEELAALLGA